MNCGVSRVHPLGTSSIVEVPCGNNGSVMQMVSERKIAAISWFIPAGVGRMELPSPIPMHPFLAHGHAVFMRVNIVLLSLSCTFGFMAGNLLHAYMNGTDGAKAGYLWLGIGSFLLSVVTTFAMAQEGAGRLSHPSGAACS